MLNYAYMNTMLLDAVTAGEITAQLPSETALNCLSDYFSALADVTRLKILSALSVSTLCVTDISALTGINQTTVSHQLRHLKSVRLVKSTRQGKVMFYSLGDKGFSTIMGCAVTSVFERESLW
ncbi:MAG: winged helix-turn-helix transcriptional regulator [Clostridiales bacterium]|nr:winged helix-turn-helix transcriptional regulator [Clostridiales bacterium]